MAAKDDISAKDEQFVLGVSKKIIEEKTQGLKRIDNVVLLPYQEPPKGEWDLWIFRGGRGIGKTFIGSYYVIQFLRRYRKDAHVIIVGPTIGNTKKICLEHPLSGLYTLYKNEFAYYNRSDLILRHRDGGRVQCFGAEKPQRLNGPECNLAWVDELALISEDAWDQLQFCVRIPIPQDTPTDYPKHPHIIATTTPKRRKFLRDLAKESGTIDRKPAHTKDNPHLDETRKKFLVKKYGGTRLGRQELAGEYIDDVEGAMWHFDWIANNRVPRVDKDGESLLQSYISKMQRIVIAIDPAGMSAAKNDETGMSVAGLGEDGDYYVFEINGYHLSPLGWGNKAIDFFDQYQCDKIIGERNNGGEMVESNIRTCWKGKNRKDAPVKTIHASRGKAVRAEPVATLYEQGRVHHIGIFEESEEQMCDFPIANELDDRVDSVVYAITELMDMPEVTDIKIAKGALIDSRPSYYDLDG